MHKKNPPPGQESPSCDIIKYCKLCGWRYYVKAGDKKTKHICAPDKCVHCRERLTGQGSHQCFIQPLEPKEPCEKYIFYDFETRYENGRHVANFVCAITFPKNLDLQTVRVLQNFDLIVKLSPENPIGYSFIKIAY